MRTNNIFRNGKIHVCEAMCSTCIFRPGNIMRLHPGRVAQMVRDATRTDTSIICHDTSYTKHQAVCHGFFTHHPTTPLQIADRLGYIQYVRVK